MFSQETSLKNMQEGDYAHLLFNLQMHLSLVFHGFFATQTVELDLFYIIFHLWLILLII